ncbi:MAG: F0F1 ATP synthase subunit delta [Verrucomicrobiia bacterium]|jgi:F-type H+-transporting ATPase subunit delta
MITSKQIRREARELFKCCRVDGVLDENRVRSIVEEVLQKKPRGYLQILKVFKRLVKLEIDRNTAIIESAVEIDEQTKNLIKENLIRLYGKNLRMKFVVNPSLIGGLRIKVGSKVYDSSIITKLRELAETF